MAVGPQCRVMKRRELSLAQDFSEFPAGRFKTDGPHSAEQFREDVLVPALSQGQPLIVVLDGNVGGASFLEEAFGGLVREHGMQPEELRRLIEFRCISPDSKAAPRDEEGDRTSEPDLEQEIWSYVDSAREP